MDIKVKMDDLKTRYLAARTQAEKDEIFDQIRAEVDADAEGVAKAALAQIKETNEHARDIIVRNKIRDILPIISLSFIAREYFGKTKEWLYQRINGNIVNGKPARFTEEELKILDKALKDIGHRLSSINVPYSALIDR